MDYKETRCGVCLPGFMAGGIKRGKYGVALIVADRVCDAAAVFTKNSVKAAPVLYTKAMVKKGIHVVVANSGNANCCTPTGMQHARDMVNEAAQSLKVDPRNIAVSSTGVIGKPMDIGTVRDLIQEVATNLSSGPKGSIQAAKAIMTTDTRIKMYSAEYKSIKIGGICKGAGMIAPNMATMLCYITTNARLSKPQLQFALNLAIEESFNMVSVDGDMSTNDTVLLMSNKTKKCKLEDFKSILKHVTVELAKMIARDGEGSSKFIEVEVCGAKAQADARRAVKAIMNSPLVKTAFYGENPNWGRIIAAAGSVVKVDERKVEVSFHCEKKSVKLLFGGKIGNLEEARKLLGNRNIKVILDLKSGSHKAVGWTCDMTPEYVNINAGYN